MKYNSSVPKSRAELKFLAKEKLKGNKLNAFIVCFLVILLSNGINLSYSVSDTIRLGEGASASFNFGQLLQLIIGGPLSLGMASYFLQLLRDEDARIEETFSGFKNFATAFLVQLLSGIFIMLWSLLFIIPGVIAALSYSMIYYVLKDNPALSAMDVLKESKKLMDGEKGRLFVLGLSFIGWIILGAVTAGIAFIWILPYINATLAAFYEELKERKLIQQDNFSENCTPLHKEIY